MPLDSSTNLAPTTPDPAALLRERFARAVQRAFPGADLPAPAVAASANPAFGDFQCSSAMSYAKALGQNPRAVAQAIVAHLDLAGLAQPLTDKAIAGPGFINITLDQTALGALLERLDTPDLGLPVDQNAPVTVVDLCGVNLAKRMHIGHLRSTVIGDTLARILERVGGVARVKRQNHVGDWGLPIAMVVAKIIALRSAGQPPAMTLENLDTLYKLARKECATLDASIASARAWGSGPKILAELEEANAEPAERMAQAKATLVRLQGGDPAVRAVWKEVYDATMSACLATCARLNSLITEAHSAGESSYESALAPLVARLEASGAAVPSEGALIVPLDDAGIAEPCLIRKRDGGFLYATTDLAAIEHRTSARPGALGASRVVYCVDARQGLHFRQVFAAARKAGLVPPGASLEHAAFGTILGDDGKPFKSRSGETVNLTDVVDDATEAALAEVRARNEGMPAAQQEAIASAVAVAAIRYTDLATERTKDYVFSPARMVKFEGNTGPYLLYALARVRSILRNAQAEGHSAPAGTPFVVAQPAEKALALCLLRHPGVIAEAGRTLEAHRLCAHLYETATAFASFFENCPVLKAPDAPTRAARLRLCALTNRVLADGLTLLGIPLLDRM
jgi:arginyl-tRNA synthetase